MKKQEILSKEWDNLIILDACRYDYFEECYDKYLEGELEKRNSEAGSTPEWLIKTFDQFLMDTTYFSANPFINSDGIPLNKLADSRFPSWKPTKKFGQIIDVWKDVDDKFNTTMPEKVVEAVINKPSLKGKVIHFIQPHLPFIHPESKFNIEWSAKNEIHEKEGYRQKGVGRKIYVKIGHIIFGTLPNLIFRDPIKVWKFREPFVPSYSISNYEQIYRNRQLDRVHEFYRYSLEETLKSVSKLLPSLNGKTIITADHGECLGEYNIWGHRNFNHNPVLTTVPWIEI